NAAGQPSEIIGVWTDVTTRKQAEAESARLARQIQLLLASTEEGICGLDLSGRFTFINRAGAEKLGYEVDELLGGEMHSLVHHHHSDGSPYPRHDCPIYL